MTIEFSNPGDVAAQHYNEAMLNGWSHEDAAKAAWDAMQLARSEQENDSDTQEQAKTKKGKK